MPTLLRDSHFVLEHYVAPNFIRLARTSQPLSSWAQAENSLRACRGALGELDPGLLGILLDWRLSPGDSDASLHRAIVEAADVFAQRFARKAVLLLTPARAHAPGRTALPWASASPRLFHDEDAAIAHVTRRP